MGSEAGYSLKATDAPRAVVGRGSIHMEANYGESFPTGWVWAQVCNRDHGFRTWYLVPRALVVALPQRRRVRAVVAVTE